MDWRGTNFDKVRIDNHIDMSEYMRDPKTGARISCVLLDEEEGQPWYERLVDFLKRNVGLLVIALGWVFAVAGWIAKDGLPLTIALYLMGFGVGWIVREERRGDD